MADLRPYIKLDDVTWRIARSHQLLIEEASRELRRLMDEQRAMLATATGVDFETEDWSLDLKHGMLERISNDSDGESTVLPQRRQHTSSRRRGGSRDTA